MSTRDRGVLCRQGMSGKEGDDAGPGAGEGGLPGQGGYKNRAMEPGTVGVLARPGVLGVDNN